MEVWRDIEGYEKKYSVSSQGNVKSLNYNNTGKERLLKQKINKYGFCEVKLSKNNKTKDFMVARLVAEAFLPNPRNKPKVIHLGENTNNSVDNLKWAYENEVHFNMYKKGSRKGKPSGYKISYKKKYYNNYVELANEYGISNRQLIHRLSKGWTLDETLTIPMQPINHGGRPRICYEFYGEYLPIKAIAKKVGLTEKQIRHRLSKGWDIYNAAETPIGKINKRG